MIDSSLRKQRVGLDPVGVRGEETVKEEARENEPLNWKRTFASDMCVYGEGTIRVLKSALALSGQLRGALRSSE